MTRDICVQVASLAPVLRPLMRRAIHGELQVVAEGMMRCPTASILHSVNTENDLTRPVELTAIHRR